VAVLSTLAAQARGWGLTGLGLLFPEAPEGRPARRIEAPFCQRCGEPFYGDLDLAFSCTNCGRRAWSLEWARAGFIAEGTVREAIHGFKYGRHYYQITRLGEWLDLAYEAHASAGGWDALVPVPLHPRRRRERGFNQSAELARQLSRSRKIPIRDCLRRRKETAVQARQVRAARLRNLRNAFDLKSRFDVAGQHLLLIDDVFTTGATADACAHALRKAGAARVCVLTVARG
jgi:competence protein ComFC